MNYVIVVDSLSSTIGVIPARAKRDAAPERCVTNETEVNTCHLGPGSKAGGVVSVSATHAVNPAIIT